MIHNKKLEHALQKVQKPGRYVGGELNSVVKDPSQVEVRFAFCFPRYLRHRNVSPGH